MLPNSDDIVKKKTDLLVSKSHFFVNMSFVGLILVGIFDVFLKSQKIICTCDSFIFTILSLRKLHKLDPHPPIKPPRFCTQILYFFQLYASNNPNLAAHAPNLLHTFLTSCTRSELLHTLRDCYTRSDVAAQAPMLLHTLRSCCTSSFF